MGLRGRKGLSEEERATRDGRKRRPPSVSGVTRAEWDRYAAELAKEGFAYIRQAKNAKLVKTPNGMQMDPRFAAGVKLLELAKEYRIRVERLAPQKPGAPAAAPTGLDAFRNRKPDAAS